MSPPKNSIWSFNQNVVFDSRDWNPQILAELKKMMSCPFSSGQNVPSGMKCPITGASTDSSSTAENESIDACPVIHAVNEEEVKEVKEQKGEETEGTEEQEEQPNSVTSALEALMKDDEEKSDIPSIAEYQKLRRTQAIITGFYCKGTETKKEQYENVKESLVRLAGDEEQCRQQIAALELREKFKGK